MWHCGEREIDTSKVLIMGVLNVTPDSFSDGGLYAAVDVACEHARQMVAEGATIIDVGGESTRPGSSEVDTREELSRVLPVVRVLANEGVIVSIDTRHAQVAQACVDEGAAIINDISGFRDPAMVEVAKSSSVGLIIVHMLGEPKTMQATPHYTDVVKEVRAFLVQRAFELEAEGIAHDRICIDPGPGFGKTFEHNLALLRATAQLADIGYPLMAAYSRKNFIGSLTGIREPERRVVGSVTAAMYAASQGARVLRVHDIAPTIEALKVLAAVQ
ncbi:MAG: dihydropteroate synthase [Coriobacteriaceae bacterium]|nr:dihydropteroate synthase [Coriobacteriaceae bacterium]